MDQPHGTVCHQHYSHQTCWRVPTSGHWRCTCSQLPGTIETSSYSGTGCKYPDLPTYLKQQRCLDNFNQSTSQCCALTMHCLPCAGHLSTWRNLSSAEQETVSLLSPAAVECVAVGAPPLPLTSSADVLAPWCDAEIKHQFHEHDLQVKCQTRGRSFADARPSRHDTYSPAEHDHNDSH